MFDERPSFYYSYDNFNPAMMFIAEAEINIWRTDDEVNQWTKEKDAKKKQS